MPRFRMEQQFQLKDALAKMGMSEMFSGSADFTAMAKGINKGDLYVSAVVHKAFLEVSYSLYECCWVTFGLVSSITSAGLLIVICLCVLAHLSCLHA